MVALHGGGIFATPERIRTLYHASVDRGSELGFTGLFAGRISARENRHIIDGRLPDGQQIPVYTFDEFKRGIADLPRHYGVVMDLDVARSASTGYTPFDDLKDDPMMIVRAGGVERAAAYLDKAKSRSNGETLGCWHSFNEIEDDQPQSCICLMYGSPGGKRARIYAPEGIGLRDSWRHRHDQHGPLRGRCAEGRRDERTKSVVRPVIRMPATSRCRIFVNRPSLPNRT